MSAMSQPIMIDNYDSFTFNLVQYFAMLGTELKVIRNDAMSAEQVLATYHPSFVVLSPGPANPDAAGISLDMIGLCVREKIPLLGVCLGHQAIGQYFGAKVVRAPQPVHGKTANIRHNGLGLFTGLQQPLTVTRYHSLVVAEESLPDCLEATAFNEDGLIMGLRHRNLAIAGVQFHPESVLTVQGLDLLRNFLIFNL